MIEEAKNKSEQTKSQPPKKKICKVCAQKPTMHPNSPYCGGCLAKRANSSKRRSRSASVGNKNSNATRSMANLQKATMGEWQPLIEVFKEYEQVLEDVRKLAAEETRPFEYQIIAMLKDQLIARKKL